MKITPTLSDDAILTELGARLTRLRLDRNLTQAQVAEQAGVAKRTVERIEAGGGAQLANFVRICRVLDIVASLDDLIPAASTSPLAMLKNKGAPRKRASTSAAPLLIASSNMVYPPTVLSAPPQARQSARQWRWGEDKEMDKDKTP
jgi:transcriptional regulator with XRE-family HTH domain